LSRRFGSVGLQLLPLLLLLVVEMVVTVVVV
jgi:hypothetical protein